MPEIRRRAVIALGARGFLALSAMLPYLGCTARTTPVVQQPLDWQHFVDQLTAMAAAQHELTWDQPTYLDQVRSLLLRCDIADAHVQSVIARYRNAHRNFPEIRDLHRTTQVQVCLLEFEAGERIALHDHPDMTGCIRCVSGRVVVRNFTELGRGASADHVRLRHDATVTMTPGMTGTLTSTNGNLHDLVAEEFTGLIDVFTPPYNDDRSRRSRWLQLTQESQTTPGEFTAVVQG